MQPDSDWTVTGIEVFGGELWITQTVPISMAVYEVTSPPLADGYANLISQTLLSTVGDFHSLLSEVDSVNSKFQSNPIHLSLPTPVEFQQDHVYWFIFYSNIGQAPLQGIYMIPGSQAFVEPPPPTWQGTSYTYCGRGSGSISGWDGTVFGGCLVVPMAIYGTDHEAGPTPTPIPGAPVIIYPSEDTYVTEYEPNLSHEISPTLRITFLDGSQRELGLIRFDLSRYTDASVVGQALLHVWVTGTLPADVRVRDVLQPNWPITTTWNTLGLMAETGTAPGTLNAGWQTIDVTYLVKQAIAGHYANGFSIR